MLLVAGTHGNEINGIFLFDQWEKLPLLINTHGIKTCKVIGNPVAKKAGKRYIHQDLNRIKMIKTYQKAYSEYSTQTIKLKSKTMIG